MKSVAAKNNVTILPQENVYRYIQSFIKSKKHKSKNTAYEYEKDIRLFFSVIKNKNIENLQPEDLNIKLADIEDYKNFLCEEYRNARGEKYKNNSINRKINAIRSLYSYLKANEFDVNVEIFKQVDELPDDTKHIGHLTNQEVWMLANLASMELHKSKEKRALILLAASTSIRKDAILKLRFRHITPSVSDKDKFIINAPDILDKGEKIYKEIHRVLYEMIIEIKEIEERTDDDYIFTLSSSAVDYMIKNLCKKADIPEYRNISFHSLKKAGIIFAHELTGDLFTAQSQGGHKTPVTTSKYYLEKKPNIAGMAMFENIPDTIFDELTRDELIQLVKSIKNGTGLLLKRKAKEILENRMRGC